MAGAGTGEPVPFTPAGGTVQRAERTTRKAELRTMSDADLQAAYRKAGALEAKELRAEIKRRENLVKPEPAAPAAPMPDPVSTEMRERLANFTPEERDQLRAEAQELRTARGETPAGAWRAVIEGAEQDRLSGTGRYARTAPAGRPAGVGPGNVPVGGTDADRRAARPRIEGESDRAYEIRTAPSRFAAESLLRGNTLGGLRAFARAEGVVTTSSDSKAGLVERLMRTLYDRHADSEAITRMVNRDRTPAAPKVKADDLRKGDMVQVGDAWGVVQGVQAYPGTDHPTEVQVSYDGGARKEWVELGTINAHESRRANTAAAAPAGAVTRLRAIPEAGQRSLGREPVADTVDRILGEVREGGLTRERAADQIAQLVQRFSINRGNSNADTNETISALLAEIAGDLRRSAPAPTMTGSQLLAQRRAARPKA